MSELGFLLIFYDKNGDRESMEIVRIDYVNKLCVDFNKGIEKRPFKVFDIGPLIAHKPNREKTFLKKLRWFFSNK